MKHLIDKTDAKVVLSSTWRIGWKHIDVGVRDTDIAKDFMELHSKLNHYGIEFYDRTPIFDRCKYNRGDEIKAYLDNHSNIEGYVIIDDMSGKLLRPCSSHLLQTSMRKGLQIKHIEIAKTILDMKI